MANTTLNIIAFVVGINFGIQVVALAFMLRGVIMFPIGLVVLKKYTKVRVSLLLNRLKGPAFATLLMVLTVLVVNNMTTHLSVSIKLLMEISSGGFIYCIVLLIIDRPVIDRVLHLMVGDAKNKSKS